MHTSYYVIPSYKAFPWEALHVSTGGFVSIVTPSVLLFSVVHQAFSVAIVDTWVLLGGPDLRIVL